MNSTSRSEGHCISTPYTLLHVRMTNAELCFRDERAILCHCKRAPTCCLLGAQQMRGRLPKAAHVPEVEHAP